MRLITQKIPDWLPHRDYYRRARSEASEMKDHQELLAEKEVGHSHRRAREKP